MKDKILELKKKTSLPLMECKAALIEVNGDLEKALEILKKKTYQEMVNKGFILDGYPR